MKRAYSTTWGTELLDGGVRFRLWAPAASSVSLAIVAPQEHVLPMARGDGGWFEVVTKHASTGTRYLFEIDGARRVADPASRFQPDGAEGASEVVDPRTFDWPELDFTVPRREHLVIYELHIGTFTTHGTYNAAAQHLRHIADLGATAVEIMPLSQAPGGRNWGYDGVLHYAPANAYGNPDDLKRFIVAAHDCGLAVLLDVVYNHFGPQGNYLTTYAPQFFSERLKTPWGAGIDYGSPENDAVRRYAIDNACYWLCEYAFDGLRLDAAPMIADSRPVHVLEELRHEAKHAAGRPIYLIAEDVKNEAVARFASYDGRWCDDVHDALHVVVTGDESPYYRPFRDAPLERMMQRVADEGPHIVGFLQNHDQVGNRPLGERITSLAAPEAVRAALAFALLLPVAPLLFMGEEWGATTPFLYFCDFEPGLARRVSEGRRHEFALLAQFADPAARDLIPDPASAQTFERSVLQWTEIGMPEHGRWLAYYRDLLRVRRESIAPLLPSIGAAEFRAIERSALTASWRVAQGSVLRVDANLSDDVLESVGREAAGRLIFETHAGSGNGAVPAWSVRWTLSE